MKIKLVCVIGTLGFMALTYYGYNNYEKDHMPYKTIETIKEFSKEDADKLNFKQLDLVDHIEKTKVVINQEYHTHPVAEVGEDEFTNEDAELTIPHDPNNGDDEDSLDKDIVAFYEKNPPMPNRYKNLIK